MDALTVNQLPLVLILFVLTVYCSYRLLYRSQDNIGRSMLVKLVLSTLLGILATTTSFTYHPWWLYFLRTNLMNYSLLLLYLAMDQLLNNKPHQIIIKHKLFLCVTAIALVSAIFDYLTRSYLDTTLAPSMITSISTVFFQPAWLFWISYLSDYGVSWCLGALIVILYWNNLRRHLGLTYAVRCFICISGFLINICSIGPFCLLMGAIYLLSFFFGRASDSTAGQICLISRVFAFLLLLVGFTIPDVVFAKALRPVEHYLSWRKGRQRELLAYLHRKMIQIVPCVHLPYNELSEIRMLIEISDARQIIWSYVSRTRPITPKEEAERLFRLLHGNIVLYSAGENLPPPIRCRNIIKHNLWFARHLKRLNENAALRSFAWTKTTD